MTGASEGVGKCFAENFAKLGFNIMLVSRDIKKLKACEEAVLGINPHVNVLSIPFDVTKNVTQEHYRDIFEKIFQNHDISVLVNNVGLRDVSRFLELPLEKVYNNTVANIIPQTLLTRYLTELFIKREKRSAVINISSSSSVYPLPNFVLYSSTKIFSDYFSRAISYELDKKVDVISVTPFYVQSSTVKLPADGRMVISSEQFVNSVLDQLGYERKTYGFWTQQIIGFFMENIVEYILPVVTKSLERRKQHSKEN